MTLDRLGSGNNGAWVPEGSSEPAHLQAAFREKERKLLAAQRLAKIGYWEWVEEGDIVLWSDECFEMWGRTRDTFTPSYVTWLESVHPEDRRLAAKAVAERRASFQFRIVRPDGSIRWIYAESEVESDPARSGRRFGINQDITDRRSIELALERSERNLLEAQRMARMGYFERDLRSGNTEWSEMMYEIFGVDPKTFKPSIESTVELVHPEDRDRFRSAVARQVPVEFRIIKADGEIRHFFGIGHLQRDPDGEPHRIFGFRQDVTVQKESERQFKAFEKELRQKQKLEYLGYMAGCIAHEFNNMLQVILIGSRQGLALLEEASPARPEIDDVLTAARRAKEIVREVLDYARNEPIPRQPMKVSEELRGILDDARRKLPSITHLVEDVPSFEEQAIIGSTELGKVVGNLLSNAKDALSGPGTIFVKLRIEDSGTDGEPSPCFRLTVEDDGCGMDEATLTRAFDPFYTTKELGKGTGLGLAIVYGTLSARGGRITASSEVGRGSSFSVFLPIVND